MKVRIFWEIVTAKCSGVHLQKQSNSFCFSLWPTPQNGLHRYSFDVLISKNILQLKSMMIDTIMEPKGGASFWNFREGKMKVVDFFLFVCFPRLLSNCQVLNLSTNFLPVSTHSHPQRRPVEVVLLPHLQWEQQTTKWTHKPRSCYWVVTMVWGRGINKGGIWSTFLNDYSSSKNI